MPEAAGRGKDKDIYQDAFSQVSDEGIITSSPHLVSLPEGDLIRTRTAQQKGVTG